MVDPKVKDPTWISLNIALGTILTTLQSRINMWYHHHQNLKMPKILIIGDVKVLKINILSHKP
jgi:hypothetical protein